jgi:hypothetical protein
MELQRVSQPSPLDLAVAAWLDASPSALTRQTYAAIVATFHAYLRRVSTTWTPRRASLR